MFLAPTFALNYGLSFAALIAAIVHTMVYHRNELWTRLRLARKYRMSICDTWQNTVKRQTGDTACCSL